VTGPEPLILTVGFDVPSQERFEALRRANFPPHLNRVPAHATLFHHLPGEARAEIEAVLAAIGRDRGPAPVRVADLRPLGRGVALRLEAPEVAEIRTELAGRWAGWLGPQDRQPWRPHVTVQNKVTPEVARRTLDDLRAGFAPWDAVAEGLLLWRYLGGPWEALGSFPFTGG